MRWVDEDNKLFMFHKFFQEHGCCREISLRRGAYLETCLKASQTLNLFLNLMIAFYDGRFSKKKIIKWLAELEAYFYFNKIPYHKKVELVIHKLSCGVRKWWFELLDFRTRISIPLISSWQDLKQLLILEFIQDDYKEILYWEGKQINYYYLPCV